MPRVSLSKLLILIVSAEFLMGASECAGKAPAFRWDPDIWAADSGTESVVRIDDEGRFQQILAKEQAFDQLICMNKTEPRKAIEAYHEVINQCERWKSPAAKAAAEHALDAAEAKLWEVQSVQVR